MRIFTGLASDLEKILLRKLSDPATGIENYRATMKALGAALAGPVLEKIGSRSESRICVACTAEDADYLTSGLLEGLVTAGISKDRLDLVCFWNGRFSAIEAADGDFDVAPIVKRYTESSAIGDSFLVIIKSIISGACVVRTNLSALIEETKPKGVFVAAPVMYQGAEERLALAFAQNVSKSFEYLTFAHDDQKTPDGKVVIPGVGGSVYERLGVEDVLSYVPEIVRARRQERFAA